MTRSDAAVVLAIDFGGSKIAMAAVGPGASIETRDSIEMLPELGAQDNLRRTVESARRLTGGAPVAAVGACTFGIPGDGGVALSPAIEGWEHLRLRSELEDAFHAPAVVVTDVKAAAEAEAGHGALVGCDPALYLNLGTGVAMALVVGGTVVYGAHGAAGEIGYSLLSAGASLGDGDVLEDVVSGMGLARALRVADGRGPAAGGQRSNEDARRVAALFDGAGSPNQSGGRVATGMRSTILGQFLDELCFHVVNLAVAVDPQRIAVGGGMVKSWEHIAPPLRAALDRRVPFPPELVTGAYPFDAALRGAMDLGLQLAGRTKAPLVPAREGIAGALVDGPGHAAANGRPNLVPAGEEGESA